MGTQGDVQPYVALGQGLQRAGHQVTICTAETFQSFIEQHGLNYAHMNDDIIQFIDSDAGKKAMDTADNLFVFIKLAIKLAKQVKPVYRRLLDQAWAAAKGSDAIIYHPKALGGYHIAEKLNIPGFLSIPFPVYVPTREFPAVIFPEWKIGDWYNILSYRFAACMSQMALGSTLNRWREETLGLHKRSVLANDLLTANGLPVPVLHCYSPHILAKPQDWPETAAATGYWFLEHAVDWQPPSELVDFIASGPAPIYVGFGSISGRDPAQTTATILDALKQTGQRAIIATGWGGLSGSDLPDNILAIDAVPHDWLFPQMSAVIHHGGAGTTAAGLRAGVPTIICSFFGDQPFWGRRVEALGVGPKPIPQKKLTADRLASAIRTVGSDLRMRKRAASLGTMIRAEDGTANAVAFIERYLHSSTMD